jgi:apoptosis-inducing factor 2
MAYSTNRQQPHVLIVGSSYGGLSTLNHCIDLAAGKPQQHSARQPPEIGRALTNRPRYTLLDERDGFCKNAHTITSC